MNTRLLRICRRSTLGGLSRLFVGLGQVQPTLMFFKRGTLCLLVEDALQGRPIRMCFPLPRTKSQAKERIFHLLDCQRKDLPTNANLALLEIG